VENHGVARDIDIEMEPAAWRLGHDMQPEKASAVAMPDLAKNPPQPIKHPAYPDYSKYSTAHQTPTRNPEARNGEGKGAASAPEAALFLGPAAGRLCAFVRAVREPRAMNAANSVAVRPPTL
jgi:hypothetical protein